MTEIWDYEIIEVAPNGTTKKCSVCSGPDGLYFATGIANACRKKNGLNYRIQPIRHVGADRYMQPIILLHETSDCSCGKGCAPGDCMGSSSE